MGSSLNERLKGSDDEYPLPWEKMLWDKCGILKWTMNDS